MQMKGGFRVRSNGQPVAQSSSETAAQDITQSPGDDAASKAAAAGQGGSTSSVPSISLPKGGGAIRGIGEKFAANPVTGTGSLSVPIATTPGRSGFGPQLSLSYDSGSGNGPFGFGWSFSLPSVTRKTDKGLPRYQDADESDVFILSGAEDLVPVLVNQDGEWQRDPFDSDDGTYTIQRYRPRIEGLFARIERWTNKQNGEIHWRSITKDNITTIYGKTANSRIFDPADPMRVFNWLICESYDDRGNAIFYKYKAEDSAKVVTSKVHEKNRSDLSRSANRYLKRIRYGNRTPRHPDEDLPERTDGMFEVVFDYGEHDQYAPTTLEVRPWPVREDTFSTYRAGFDVRTYRLCQRVLMFHHFPDELVTDDYLVRSTEFTYDESIIASFITGITQSGYVRKTDGTYLKKSLPPLEFEYSQAEIQDEIREIDAESLDNLPIGLDGMLYQWVDLDGEGLSGVLTEQADAWFYKPNQGGGKFGSLQLLADKPSLANLSSGRQQFMDLAGDGQLDLVELSGPVPGFYERTHDQHWERFTPFDLLPNLDWNDPNLKFLDLTGDGHADIMITEDEAFTWHPSIAEQGFGPSIEVYKTYDEEKGPGLIFADGTQSIYLADLSGDGLTDLVRIRNGEVCYWPNLGYGRFGTKVTMDNAPWFDTPDLFNQQRIRLADIDGSGTTDIIYLGHDGVHIYFNQSGNGWSEGQTLTQFPHIDNLSAVTVVDLHGNGTACLAWSSPLPGDARQQMRYIDLMGGQKPHLLVSTKNNMGAETRVQYAPSTKFYLADKEAGKPWITRIPFPVHVVERVETYDRISRNRFVTRYAYHHGYFDGTEREFRGFGMVEQWDTEEFSALSASDAFPSATNIDEASHVPPVLTRTWFHTGAYLDGSRISRQFEDEYYRESDLSEGVPGLTDAQLRTMLLDDTVLPDTIRLDDGTRIPFDLSAEEAREACRSLKGSILRQEIYALDGTDEEDRPYSVSERNYTIELKQPREPNRHAVFFAHPRETIDFHYERKLYDIGGQKLADPRVTHAMTLAVDEFGNVERSVAIGYPRRAVPDRQDEQTETDITFTVNRFVNSMGHDDWYRVGLPVETQTYEIVNPPEPEVSATSVALFKLEYIRTLTEGLFGHNQDEPDTLKTHPYEKWNWRKDTSTPSETGLRLIERVRTLYRKNDLTGFLPLGDVESLALPGEAYKLAFTPGLLTAVYKRERTGQATENLLPNPSAVLGSKDPDGGGYVDLDGNGHWWIPSGLVFYWQNLVDDPPRELDFARKHFFLPHRFCDPFGKNTVVAYDSSETDPQRNYSLLLIETCDPLDNTVLAQNNYRVLQPELVTDPNGAVSEALFDALGLVVATAVHKGDVGDSLQHVQADLTPEQVDDFFADPRGQGVSRLGTATTCIVYDVDRYYLTGNPDKPPYAATIARETHVSDPVPAGDELKVQISFSYSDGFGREIQKKIQAEPGPVNDVHTDPRWVGSGWTIFNNKGKPVRKYEPFFSTTHQFEFAKTVGVSSTLFYDPLGRVVATLHPNHTYEKVVFDPWRQETWDVNDMLNPTQVFDPSSPDVLPDHTFNPADDPDVGEHFRRSPQREYLPTWYDMRMDTSKAILKWPDVDPTTGAPIPQNTVIRAAEKSAAEKAVKHAATPEQAYLDTLGRTFLTVADNGLIPDGTRQEYKTHVELDIEGNQREVIDARGCMVMQYEYNMQGNHIKQDSMDAGERWRFNNVAGNPIRAWNSRNYTLRYVYDALLRPTHLFVREGDDNEILVERTIYGETHPDSQPPDLDTQPPCILNLRGQIYQHYDGAGAVTSEEFDFKGNLLRSSRRVSRTYRETMDWSTLAGLTRIEEIETAASSLLEDETFVSSSLYDALNRPITLITPHTESIPLNEIRPAYNEAGLLDKVDARLRDADEWTEFVTNINYDAKGQREMILYENGVCTEYEYDPDTFRLNYLNTTRSTNDRPLQDLRYTYDPVGNITEICDDAHRTIFYDNGIIKPCSRYEYDALYRLIQANGREHESMSGCHYKQDSKKQTEFIRLTQPINNAHALINYIENYTYDQSGNLTQIKHNGRWTRNQTYSDTSNHLETSHVSCEGALPFHYPHDPNGNITAMPHLPELAWDYADRLERVDLDLNGNKAYYTYDASGQRVRKVVEKGSIREERIYLGGFEIYRKYQNGSLKFERQTLHVMDDQKRIALVETRTIDTDDTEAGQPEKRIRFQLDNHLGSSVQEVDDTAQAHIISYEEYYPYGGTAYIAGRSETEVKRKRYRYSGKERDGETGLYYYGARYYAPWLGRWTSCDPIGLVDGINLYQYVYSNPINHIDLSGMCGDPPPTTLSDTARSRRSLLASRERAQIAAAQRRQALEHPPIRPIPAAEARQRFEDWLSQEVMLESGTYTRRDLPAISLAEDLEGLRDLAEDFGGSVGYIISRVASDDPAVHEASVRLGQLASAAVITRRRSRPPRRRSRPPRRRQHIGSSGPTTPTTPLNPGAESEACVPSVAAMINRIEGRRQLGTVSDIQHEYGAVLGPAGSRVPNRRQALRYIERATGRSPNTRSIEEIVGAVLPRGTVGIEVARLSGHYAIFVGERHVAYARVRSTGSYVIVDPILRRQAFRSFSEYREYLNQHGLLGIQPTIHTHYIGPVSSR